MVRVHCSYTVTPSAITPTGKFCLSHVDQIKLSTHAPLLYIFKPHHTDNASSKSAVEILTSSLSRAFVHYYKLAGRLCETSGGRWEVNCNARGAQVLEASCGVNLDDSSGFLPAQIMEQLMPDIDYGCPIEEVPLLVVQLTKFACGGVAIGIAICRALVDGVATMKFVNSWAKLARGEQLDSRDFPFLDLTLLNSYKLRTGLCFDHSEFCPPPVWRNSLVEEKAAVERNQKASVVAILGITKDQVENLKKKVRDNGHGNREIPPQRPYSSFEIIGGHLWRCLCKAYYVGNDDQPTRLSTLVNCRNRLRPLLPNNYFGNATLPTVTPTCSFDEIISKPLTYAVGNLRQALDRLADGYVRSALDYIASQKDMRFLRNPRQSSAASRGNPNLNIVSWMNFPFQEADFGWGKPVYLGPGRIEVDGKAFIMNNGSGDGFIVAIRLPPSHMDAFKKLFYDEMKVVFPASKL